MLRNLIKTISAPNIYGKISKEKHNPLSHTTALGGAVLWQREVKRIWSLFFDNVVN